MPKWNVTLRKRLVGTRDAKVGPEWLDDPSGDVYPTTLTGDEFRTVADVRKYADESWKHSTFVSAVDVNEKKFAPVAKDE